MPFESSDAAPALDARLIAAINAQHLSWSADFNDFFAGQSLA